MAYGAAEQQQTMLGKQEAVFERLTHLAVGVQDCTVHCTSVELDEFGSLSGAAAEGGACAIGATEGYGSGGYDAVVRVGAVVRSVSGVRGAVVRRAGSARTCGRGRRGGRGGGWMDVTSVVVVVVRSMVEGTVLAGVS